MFISQSSDQTLGTRTANKDEGKCLLAWPALCNWAFLFAVYGHGILCPGTGQDLFHKPPNRDPFEDRADTRGGDSRFQPSPTNRKGGHWLSVRAKGEWAGGRPRTPRCHTGHLSALWEPLPGTLPPFLVRQGGEESGPQSTARKGAGSQGSACLTPESPLSPHLQQMGRSWAWKGRPGVLSLRQPGGAVTQAAGAPPVCLGPRSSESADALPAAGLCAQCGRALLWMAGMGPSAPCPGHLLVPPAPKRAGAWPGDRELPLWSSAFWELLRCGAQTASLSPDSQPQAWELSAESDAQGLWAPGGGGKGVHLREAFWRG